VILRSEGIEGEKVGGVGGSDEGREHAFELGHEGWGHGAVSHLGKVACCNAFWEGLVVGVGGTFGARDRVLPAACRSISICLSVVFDF